MTMKTRIAAGEMIVQLSDDETDLNVRELLLNSRIDLITRRVHQQANPLLLPINNKISAKYGHYY